MTCPGCSQENPEGARFCGGCGAVLEVICAACQGRNPPGNRFCHQCGGQPRQTWMSQVAIGRLHAARGRREEALGHYRAAWTIIAGLRAGTQNRDLRTGLEFLPLIREVEDLAGPDHAQKVGASPPAPSPHHQETG